MSGSQEVALKSQCHWGLRMDYDIACLGHIDVENGLSSNLSGLDGRPYGGKEPEG